MTLMIDRPFVRLESWIAYFQDVEIPVLRQTAQHIEALSKREEFNARKLATVVLHDPLMILRLFIYIARHRGLALLDRTVRLGPGAVVDRVENLLLPHRLHGAQRRNDRRSLDDAIEHQLVGRP